MSKPVTVYEVLYDCDDAGPAADGTRIYRSRSKSAADDFAGRSTCYGRPARAERVEVPRPLAQRWGLA